MAISDNGASRISTRFVRRPYIDASHRCISDFVKATEASRY